MMDANRPSAHAMHTDASQGRRGRPGGHLVGRGLPASAARIGQAKGVGFVLGFGSRLRSPRPTGRTRRLMERGGEHRQTRRSPPIPIWEVLDMSLDELLFATVVLGPFAALWLVRYWWRRRAAGSQRGEPADRA